MYRVTPGYAKWGLFTWRIGQLFNLWQKKYWNWQFWIIGSHHASCCLVWPLTNNSGNPDFDAKDWTFGTVHLKIKKKKLLSKQNPKNEEESHDIAKITNLMSLMSILSTYIIDVGTINNLQLMKKISLANFVTFFSLDGRMDNMCVKLITPYLAGAWWVKHGIYEIILIWCF